MIIVFKKDIFFTDNVRYISVTDLKTPGTSELTLYFTAGPSKNAGPLAIAAVNLKIQLASAYSKRSDTVFDLDQFAMEEK